MVRDLKVAKLEFEMFCKQREWIVINFEYNPKNSKQFLGTCSDNMGMTLSFLISENGKYYELLGGKKYREVVYTLKKQEGFL